VIWYTLTLSVTLRPIPNHIHTAYFSPIHKCKTRTVAVILTLTQSTDPPIVTSGQVNGMSYKQTLMGTRMNNQFPASFSLGKVMYPNM